MDALQRLSKFKVQRVEIMFSVGDFVEDVDKSWHWVAVQVMQTVSAMILVTFVGWSSCGYEDILHPAANESENGAGKCFAELTQNF